ncbi:MAG: hypothetical protein R3F07_16380 [Opitutaceae bacterium]
MIRRDFMLRMIDQVAALVERILKGNLSSERVGMELDAVSAEWIGLPSSILLALPAEEVIRLFEDSDRMVAEKCFLMAEVCRALALVAADGDERKSLLRKSRCLYDRTAGAGLESELQSRIDGRLIELERI